MRPLRIAARIRASSPTSFRFPIALLAVLVPVLAARSQDTELISVSTSGAASNGANIYTAVSRDARYVAWQSAATNLVASDTNGSTDIFVRDRLNATTTRVSVGTGDVQGNDNSNDPVISGDGRYVAFFSYATNLVANDQNGAPDCFVHDLVTGQTFCISVDANGNPGNAGSRYPSFSGDARYIAFHSAASNLVAGDTNGVRDVFVYEVATGHITLESLDAGGVQANADSANPVLSHDGRLVAFESYADNLVPGDTNGQVDLFVRDRVTGAIERIDVSTGGIQSDGPSSYPAISADGRFISFSSEATNLVAGDTNLFSDVFVRDRLAGTTERVSVSSTGAQASGYSYDATISPDGRWIAFPSRSINLVPGDNNSAYDMFLHDRLTGTTERVSLTSSGHEADQRSLYPSMTPDGRYVAFDSEATNLVPGDVNDLRDIFLRDRGPTAAYIFPFCFGDGAYTATPCPCDNAGIEGNGCANSVNANGAHLAASGLASLAQDTLVLSGSGMPDSTTLYFQGTLRQAGGAGTAFGDGLRCAGGATVRLGTKTNTGGASQYPGAGDATISVRGGDAAGDIRTYQAWYRNAASFCTASTFNLTNGVQVVWGL